MTIVDEKFGSEIVTDKGKIYKFDAIECMINHSNKESLFDNDGYTFWVSDSNIPGELINARYSYFLRSKAIPSPMGMYLSGYNNQRSALIKQNDIGGEIYSWKELIKSFTNLPELSSSQ
jgi:copper chaperone NosL